MACAGVPAASLKVWTLLGTVKLVSNNPASSTHTQEEHVKTSKLMMAMTCCAAMSGAALAQNDHSKKVDPSAKPAAAPAQPAGEKKGGMPAMSEMERAMMEAGTPGEQHAWIAKGVGTWDCTLKAMMPDQPVQEMKGTMTTEMILGGRYSRSMFKCDFMGMPFEGIATLGYNNTSGKFESSWMDNMGTATTFMSGSVDKDGKVMTLTGECIDPMTKKPCTMRQVTTMRSDNEIFEEFYKTIDGKEAKGMEITYKRAKGAAMEKGAVDKLKADAEKMKKQAEDAMKGAMPGGKK